MPEPQRARTFDRAERKFDLMQELGCDLLMVCCNVVAGLARRHRPRRRRLPRARRARRQARPARRLRGAGLGPPHQRLPRRLGGRAPRRPSGDRPRPRQLPHLRAQDRSKADARHSRATGSSSCSSPTRRGSTWTSCTGAGTSAASPARAICRWSTSWQAVLATGYDGDLSLEIFNDQFRAGSPRAVAIDGQRSLIYLMDQLRENSGAGSLGIPAMPPRSQCLGVEFIEFAVDDRTRRRAWRCSCRSRLSQGRRSTSRKR